VLEGTDPRDPASALRRGSKVATSLRRDAS